MLIIFQHMDWEVVGVYTGCDLYGRILYPFFHANLLHATLNAWCLLSIVFIYDIKIWRLLLSYIIAATIPIDTLGNFVDNMTLPTVGLSAMILSCLAQYPLRYYKVVLSSMDVILPHHRILPKYKCMDTFVLLYYRAGNCFNEQTH